MNEKNKNILLAILIVGIISMTVAFAALTTGLKLQGTANVAETRWNIHFQSWALDTENTITVEGRTQQNTAEYPALNQLTMSDSSNVTKVEGINVTLKQPGDYVKYTFQIINEGTIAGKLNSFTPTITNNTNNVIGYTVACYPTAAKTGEAITTNYVLGVTNGNNTVYCDLKVEYKDVDNTQTPGQNQIYTQNELNTTITAEWQWIQDDTVANNNQGGNSGNEPGSNTPVAKTWDNYITSTQASGDTLPAGTKIWIQQDGDNNNEVCATLSDGNVCMAYESSGYEADYEDVTDGGFNITTIAGLQATRLKGYSLAKAEEMLTKGAECEVLGDGFSCYEATTRINCTMFADGSVYCNYNNGSLGCDIEEGYIGCE